MATVTRITYPQDGPNPTAGALERLASDLHSVAFDFLEPATSVRMAEDRIARVEDIANKARMAVRG